MMLCLGSLLKCEARFAFWCAVIVTLHFIHFMPGAVEKEVKSLDEMVAVLEMGTLRRATASTNMNNRLVGCTGCQQLLGLRGHWPAA
jgi:hypothetical protein